MAGDWIKMRPSLLTSPKVNGIARMLERDAAVSRALTTGFNGGMAEIVSRNVMRYVTVASLLTVWSAANEHTSDGVFRNADLSDIDDMAGIPGFGDAMESVGWAIYDAEEDSVTLPNFNEYNTCGKSRAATSAAERQRRYREKQKQNRDADEDVTRDVTRDGREEKRREEVKNPPKAPPAGERKKPRRGERLSQDWELPDEWRQWAEAKVPSVDADREAEKFRNFWIAKAGKDAAKLDWFATWQNWCRKAEEMKPKKGDKYSPEALAI